MSTYASGHQKRGPTSTVRHSKDDALDRREYERLVAATYNLDEFYGLQARFVILVAGRLGLRAGEIAHMRADWIDWRRNMIVIPRHQDCQKGRDGGPCGYCKRKAEQMTEHDEELSFDAALARRWEPKTEAAAREIPFDSDPRAELAIEEFFERFDAFPTSRQSVNRRVDRAAEAADGLAVEDVYPHCLRASAASEFAASGLDVFSLKSVMGWSQLSTAQCYIASSGERTARAIRDAHR